jgi:hypothetical protein
MGAQVHAACRDREAHRPQDPAAAQWPVFARGAADARSHAPDGRWHAGGQFHAAPPGGRSWLTADELAESHWDDCEREAFEQAWQVEADDLATKPYTERFYLATGRLLPIWNLLGDEAQVRRLVTQDGRSLLGRIVPAEAVNMLLDKLGIGDRIALSPEQLVDAALAARWCPSMPCPAPASSVPASMASSGLRSSALIPALCLRGRPRAASPRSSPIRPGCSCR